MVFGKEVEMKSMDIDRYGRNVGIVAIDKQLFNEEVSRPVMPGCTPSLLPRDDLPHLAKYGS